MFRLMVADVDSPSYFVANAAASLGFFKAEGIDIEFEPTYGARNGPERLRDGTAKGPHRPAFTADGKELVTQSGNRLYHWDLAAGKLRKAVEIPLPPRHGMLRSPDGTALAVSSGGLPRNTPVALWDAATG